MKNLFATVLIAFALTSCSSMLGLQQDLNVSYQLSPGMSKSEVELIMGSPAKSDFSGEVEEWYCLGRALNQMNALPHSFMKGTVRKVEEPPQVLLGTTVASC
ncbi:MAG: outer membrane protein assembly factor BamE [Phaeodactylibacter xiamenensis]|uniref:Lipoprotein SmpA/OmlA domain-containing protein n=1 Tax=Phaeodactylibacter xiamenensis TaxID=1524460 RepID=A0A098RY68_9BACT|nr:outer membrane protein assembly factor BamE [Phaeodactylibacter xiamenensis]KGE85129.1 hypothetical protein IX84_28990 [Phaeodactylibacter xiamenensis]MCR9051740.1 outer membrane protein assembly factor BamE [bacterium]